ncbi:helix-turn-helix domain-containing protein [Roseomonas sp. E05]|uniref:MerR family transcriptional regulator n=1 Tax=Roseomonas sp. E05 TaxID=3046310 RepID=UPI0024B91ECF|nr:helix-turn-helix domain-containing protein [Roseomonas sp. E05]MDJ0387968.1 helix-turn-helix domain-containing protein [Roseomonas sp. E05]
MDQPMREIPAAARHAIGELARRTGVKATTIRWYEQEGLLPPPARSEGGHRLYSDDHLRRLGFIRHARELGFAMPAIRTLLGLAGRPREDCTTAHALAKAQIAEIDSRLRRLEALRTELAGMAAACEGGPAQDCRILETLADFEHGHCQHHEHETG